jgi:hypothetical protein
MGAMPSVSQNRSLNHLTLRVFGPVLVLTGLGGFLIPADLALMSGAPAYNVFHLVFGVLAMGLAARGGLREAVAFNVGFGALDLYQAVASWGHWWPEVAFQWTVADDVAHVVIGLALVGVGLSGR